MVQGKAFVVRMWEMEWQAVLAFEPRVTGRGQSVRLERERPPPAANESEEELPPQPVSKLQSQSFGLSHKCFFGCVNFCYPISYHSKSCCALWLGSECAGQRLAGHQLHAEVVLFPINDLANETVKVAGGATQQRTVVVTLESTKVMNVLKCMKKGSLILKRSLIHQIFKGQRLPERH